MGGFKSHKDEPTGASVPDDVMVLSWAFVVCSLEITHYESDLHNYGDNIENIDIVNKGPDNEKDHDTDEGCHNHHYLLCLVIHGSHTWDLKRTFLEYEAKNEEYEPHSEDIEPIIILLTCWAFVIIILYWFFTILQKVLVLARLGIIHMSKTRLLRWLKLFAFGVARLFGAFL